MAQPSKRAGKIVFKSNVITCHLQIKNDSYEQVTFSFWYLMTSTVSHASPKSAQAVKQDSAVGADMTTSAGKRGRQETPPEATAGQETPST